MGKDSANIFFPIFVARKKEDSAQTMLIIKNASIRYGAQPLFTNFNLHLMRGETMCISGRSGCGKSSLLNAILGFTPLYTGDITLNGIRHSKETIEQIRRQIAWIPQELALPVEWVSEMVQLPFTLKVNRGTPFSEEKLFACFEELGLEQELYRKRVSEISGGQRQRMMIAVTAMLKKPLVIVDEPTSALDAGSSQQVLDFFRKLAEEQGSAILVVSHDKNLAAGCHRHIIMEGYDGNN